MIFAKIIIKITSAPHRVRQSADAIIINQSLHFHLNFGRRFGAIWLVPLWREEGRAAPD